MPKKEWGRFGFPGFSFFQSSDARQAKLEDDERTEYATDENSQSKIFSAGSFLDAKVGSNPSWTWRSILEGRKVILAGGCWRIGSGSRVIIDSDLWLPKSSPSKPHMVPESLKGQKVQVLIDPISRIWREDAIREVFLEDDAQTILAIPLPRYEMNDKLIWHYTSDGNYSVKSGYESALALRRNGCFGRRARGKPVIGRR